MNENKIKITPMNFPADKEEIANWQTKYAGTPEFNSIYEYILENNTYYTLGEVIEINYEKFPIGDDEKLLSLVAKNNQNEIVGFSIICVYDINTPKPQMFLRYIVINPAYQSQGYGTIIAKELFLNAEKYIGVKPDSIFAYIDQTNYRSQHLFQEFNFKFTPKDKFFYAETHQPCYLNEQPSLNYPNQPGE